jgi:hypothetical protein
MDARIDASRITRGSEREYRNAVTAAPSLSNDALILRLHFAVNHLSRWLTPIHDQSVLQRSVHRGEPTVKSLVLAMRDEELKIFPYLYAVSVQTFPDLDQLAPMQRSVEVNRQDDLATTIEIMAEFRRLRQSTCSLLRSLPDNGWAREGVSRREHNWTIRQLAEHLAVHDEAVLTRLDRALARTGARTEIASTSRAPLGDLLRLSQANPLV